MIVKRVPPSQWMTDRFCPYVIWVGGKLLGCSLGAKHPDRRRHVHISGANGWTVELVFVRKKRAQKRQTVSCLRTRV